MPWRSRTYKLATGGADEPGGDCNTEQVPGTSGRTGMRLVLRVYGFPWASIVQSDVSTGVLELCPQQLVRFMTAAT